MGKSTPLLSLLTASAVLLGGVSAALNPIVIKGSKFFYSNNGTQFYIKGVAYQSGIGNAGSGTESNNTAYNDPLADTAACQRDIPYLQQLGANTIRTYAIDPTRDHSTCMSLLDAAGIYVISDLGQPNLSINREDPAWTTDLYDRYTAVVDSLAPYNNVIGFFAGNEVTNNLSYTEASAFVKAAVRDTKAYIKSKGYHSMGVGYAADDDASVRAQVAAYFNCGDVADQIDFWGYNIYEWCGESNYVESGYADRTAEFEGYSVPAFFAEYGCNTQGGGAAGRMFTEVGALYGENMTGVFSGGIVYEYFEEANDYGLVSVDGTSASTLADYNAFSTQIHAVSPTGVNSASYTPTNTLGQACPTLGVNWSAVATPLPPPPSDAACSCMLDTLACVATSATLSNETAIGPLFGEVCGLSPAACAGVARNASTGTYGAYSMCNSTAQLNFVLNQYYLGQKSVASACNFGGMAQIVKPVGAASTCSSVFAAASSAASNTAAASGSTATGAASTTSKKSDASGLTYSATFCGKYVMGAFTILAVVSGAGMVLL
jgi:hypothetical protein